MKGRPVIGIFSQPHDYNPDNHYIAASYAKWLESAGATSIPIPYDANDDLIHEIFGQINGILFPGGSAVLPQAAKTIFRLAMEANKNGEYVPIWGTCLGFEWIVRMSANCHDNSGDYDCASIMDGNFHSKNVSLPLIFPTQLNAIETKGVYTMDQSQLYPSTNPSLREILSTRNVTMNNHFYAVTPEKFLNNVNLTQAFYISSTNVDLTGRRFISTIESRKGYPVWATQYHPEKNNFEYGLQPGTNFPYEAINHSAEAVAVSIHLATFFVGQVRQSTRGAYTLADRHPLIHSYPVVTGSSFEQEYQIPPAKHWDTRWSTKSGQEQHLKDDETKNDQKRHGNSYLRRGSGAAAEKQE